MTWNARADQPRAHRQWWFLLGVFLATLTPGCAQEISTPSSANSGVTFEQLSAQATSAREAGRVDEAILLYRNALQLRADWAEGWWYVGTLNYDADRYTDAIPALHALVALNPEMGPALAFLGLSEFETHDYKNALLHLQQAQRQGYEDDAELAKVAVYHLALLYNWSGEFEKTVEVLGPTIGQRRAPDEVKVALGMALLRIPLLVTDLDPGKDALIEAAGEAAVLQCSGNPAAAAEKLRQLLEDHPRTPFLHYAYAAALENAGKNQEALREFSEETRVSPQSALPYLRVASLNLQIHRAEIALPSARKAVLLAPQSRAAHEILGQTLQTLGHVQEAAKEFSLAKKMESNEVELDSVQRQIYARQSYARSRPGEDTVQLANSGAPRQPGAANPETSFEALTEKAAAAQAAGQADAAISFYRQALALRPEWDEGWRNLGTLCYASSRYADAIAALKNAVAGNANNGSTWALLGLSEFETGDYNNSLIHLERGRDMGFAGNPAAVRVARYHLAILLNRNGEFDKATDSLTPEAGSSPPDEKIRLALGMALLRIAQFPDQLDSANELLVRLAGEAAELLLESKYDEAFADFLRLLKMNSSQPYLHYAYGSALAAVSRYDEAEEQLAEETKINPESALPFLRRSAIALQLRRAENALQFAQRAAQLTPQSAEAHYLWGRSCLESGKTADSVMELETARGLAPNSPEVRFSLARAYAKAGQPDAAERERAAFERLNAQVESRRSHSGSQAYGAIQNRSGIRAAESSPAGQSESHPQ